MIRLLLIALCVQVAVVNTVTAVPFCVHAQSASQTMQSNTVDGHHDHLQAQVDSGEAGDDCPCHCDVVVHCSANTAGLPNFANLVAFDDWQQKLPPVASAAPLPAHKNRLYRPPSIT